MIYLDYAATTPLSQKVIEKMQQYMGLNAHFANASSQHLLGHLAGEGVRQARLQVANAINALPEEIIFTSGATEAINLALQGVANFYKVRGNHIITCKTEHSAVLNTCFYLETQGFNVTYLDVDKAGLIDIDQLEKAITEKTILVSLMHVNNETGVVQDFAKISQVIKEKNCLFHLDAAQSLGKIKLDAQKMKADLISLSSHKHYGPKGIGALYTKLMPRVKLKPLVYGGGQERNLRGGTLPVHQIVGMGEASALAAAEFEDNYKTVKKCHDALIKGLSQIDDIVINGAKSHKVPHIVNVTFNRIPPEGLLSGLAELALSSGSACSSKAQKPSPVLTAMGLTATQAKSSLRFSLGKYSTLEEIDKSITIVKAHIHTLRQMPPLWGDEQ